MLDAALPPGRLGTSTPGWLLRAAGLVVVLALLAGMAVLLAAGLIGDAARTVGRDAEPSVALALSMTSTLADMDAAAIDDSLIDQAAAAGTSRAFREDTARLSRDLVEAARAITYGEAEAEPLRQLQQALSDYEEAVVGSRYIGGGSALITARRVEWASRVNREFAAPPAQALADANATVLEDHWARYQSLWLVEAGAGVAALAALVAVLAGVQFWLAKRTRRIVNPALALATVTAAAATVWFGSAAFGAHATLRSAKVDAYDSLHVLFQAKSTLSAIRADGSLWLLDPTGRAATQDRIDRGQQALVGQASHDAALARTLLAGLQTALGSESAGEPQRALAQTPKPGGLLGAELGNITFGVPERQAASDAVYRVLAADTLLGEVQAQAGRDRTAAVARWLEAGPGGGVASFLAAQAALDQTIEVNQAAFDQDNAIASAQAGLIAPVAAGALILVVLLSVGGLWLRLREYR